MHIEYGIVGKPAAMSQAVFHVLRALKSAAPSALISAAATLWCWHATGPGLGLYLGAILLATLYTPALVLAETSRAMWIPVAAIAIASALLLVISNGAADISASEWLHCSIVLAAYVWALAGVAALLSLGRLPAPLAAALTVFVGLLWLTWPVWLSHWMTQGLADWLTPANPLLAINSVLKHLGTWDRAPIAYRALTVLNQDVPYHLPVGIFYAVILHMVIGAPGMILLTRRSRDASIAPV
jgi:hypothetical protein